jgi:hypothetical protein
VVRARSSPEVADTVAHFARPEQTAKAITMSGIQGYFRDFAETPSPTTGKLLKFTKAGEFVCDDKIVMLQSRFIADMDSLRVGYTKWKSWKPVEQRMGLVAEGYRLLPREEMGDTDESRWDTDNSGKLVDPWTETVSISLAGDDGLCSFVTSTKGGVRAVKALVLTYSNEMLVRRNEYPVVELAAESYSNRYGTIFNPIMNVVDWVSKVDLAIAGTRVVPEYEKGEFVNGQT